MCISGATMSLMLLKQIRKAAGMLCTAKTIQPHITRFVLKQVWVLFAILMVHNLVTWSLTEPLWVLCQEMREGLFGGCGFVPDIPSLQAWLECAWGAGFDKAGAEQLGGKVQGSHKWVGTTEATALLRLFGVRAHIVDFKGALLFILSLTYMHAFIHISVQLA